MPNPAPLHFAAFVMNTTVAHHPGHLAPARCRAGRLQRPRPLGRPGQAPREGQVRRDLLRRRRRAVRRLPRRRPQVLRGRPAGAEQRPVGAGLARSPTPPSTSASRSRPRSCRSTRSTSPAGSARSTTRPRAGSPGTSSPTTCPTPRATSASTGSPSTTTATRGPTSTSTSSTSSGRGRGRRTLSSRTARPASTRTTTRCTRSTTRARATGSRGRTWSPRRRSARRCSSRPAPPRRAATFAARNAEAAFIQSPHPRGRRPRHRRHPPPRRCSTAVVPRTSSSSRGCTSSSASTEEEAQRKSAELDEWIDFDAQLSHMSGAVGIDFGHEDLDRPDRRASRPRACSAIIGWIHGPGHRPASRRCATWRTTPLRNSRVVGTPEQIADRLAQWRRPASTGSTWSTRARPGSYEEFVDHVIPVLQDRGLAQREYAEGTLRQQALR